MKKAIGGLMVALMVVMMQRASASPQTSDADLKAAQSAPAVVDGLFVMSGFAASFSGPTHFTNLMFGVVSGNSGMGGPYFVADSPVTICPCPMFGSAFGGATATLEGEVSVLTMDDENVYSASGACSFECDGSGLQVDSWTVNLSFGGSSATLNADQSAPLAMGAVNLGDDGNTMTLNASAVTSLSCTTGLNCSGGSLTMNGAFDQGSVDGILLAAVGSSGGSGVLTIGGTSASPSATGAGYVATLVADGITVTTN